MRIGILSNNSRLYSTKRIVDAARARGHTMRVLETFRMSLAVDNAAPKIFLKGKALGGIDAVIPRLAASQNLFGMAIVRQFEHMGIYCLNTAEGIAASRDKLRTMQVLGKNGIGIPPTAFVFNRADIDQAIAEIGGMPLVIKLLEGTQGAGVMLADSQTIAHAIIEALQAAQQNALLQKFVSESRGRDVRAFVVGSSVVAAMRRKARGEEFRSNVHLGAETEKVKLDPEYEKVAIRATELLGLHIAGVDILESHAGPRVMEVNSSPGLEGIESATGVDVASAIIEFLERDYGQR